MGECILTNKSGGATPTITNDFRYQLLGDITVSGSAVTSVDFTGLNMKMGEEYLLVSTIYNPNGSSGVSYSLLFNGNNTETNYYI